MIHGGPFAAYTPAFFDEAQVLAEAGYAVLMCNPRGSSGYGQAHARAIKGALGELDMADVLAFLDHCLVEVSGLDANRVGVMGGSYGGYLTAWLIAHTARFSAAIVERGYLDPRSMIGAADIGWYFPEEYHRDLAAMDRQSAAVPGASGEHPDAGDSLRAGSALPAGNRAAVLHRAEAARESRPRC